MSSIVFNQDFDNDLHPIPERSLVAARLEFAANQLREKGSTNLYLGGSVSILIDLDGTIDPGIAVEA